MQSIQSIDIVHYPSPHTAERDGTPIALIVLHCMGTPLHQLFTRLQERGVSAHYIVPQLTARALQHAMPDPFAGMAFAFPDQVPVIQLVEDRLRAWHAGVSQFAPFHQLPGCEKGLNACSIGIEFHAPGFDDGEGGKDRGGGKDRESGTGKLFAPYTEAQQHTGIALIRQLVARHQIPASNLLAHSSIAVGRKIDPGPLFFWQALAQQGLGYLPPALPPASLPSLHPLPQAISATSPTIRALQAKLARIGFSGCPQDGLWQSLSPYVDAYMMQFASHLWQHVGNPLTEPLWESLMGFDESVYSISDEFLSKKLDIGAPF